MVAKSRQTFQYKQLGHYQLCKVTTLLLSDVLILRENCFISFRYRILCTTAKFEEVYDLGQNREEYTIGTSGNEAVNRQRR
jgi:hypothetical protein